MDVFDDAFGTIEEAIDDIRNGKMIVVVDDRERENEGDVVVAAERVTADDVNFMVRFARGLVCVPIAPEQAERIFDYLRRENNCPAPGWGIGLPFVQSVAESHGGSIAVDSAPETGTSFIFDVPVDCRPFVPPAGAPKSDS